MSEDECDDLVVGPVGAAGTDLPTVEAEAASHLGSLGYDVEPASLSANACAVSRELPLRGELPYDYVQYICLWETRCALTGSDRHMPRSRVPFRVTHRGRHGRTTVHPPSTRCSYEVGCGREEHNDDARGSFTEVRTTRDATGGRAKVIALAATAAELLALRVASLPGALPRMHL